MTYKKNKKESLSIFKKIVILYLLFLNIFSVYTCILNNSYDNKYKSFNEEEIEIIGTIISDVNKEDYKYTYEIKVDSINKDKYYKGDILLVNTKNTKGEIELDYGNKILIKGTFEEPVSIRNYKGFDYKFYLKTRKIYGKVFTEKNSIKVLKKKNLNILNITNNIIKVKIRKNIKELLKEENANLELGLLLGDSKGIDEDIRNAFKDSSVSHMIAISGQHMTYVILIINFIFNKKVFGNNGKRIFSIIIIILFTKLVGATVSVTRAGITAILYLMSGLIHRKNDTITTLSLGLLLIITLNPFEIFNIGAQLSYVGTVSIILIYNLIKGKIDDLLTNKLEKNKSKFLEFFIGNILLTISANVLIIPIIIYHFNTVSMTFILSNLILSSLIGVAIIMGFITIFTSFISINLAKLPACILNIILNFVVGTTKFFAQLKISKIYVITPNLTTIMLWYIIIFLFIGFIKNKDNITKIIKKYKIIIKYVIVIILIISLISKGVLANTRNLGIYFVDVGQGDCSLIITPQNNKILIDGGGSSDPKYDIGEKVLIPYLLDRKIKNIDYVFISHFDSDHCRSVY